MTPETLMFTAVSGLIRVTFAIHTVSYCMNHSVSKDNCDHHNLHDQSTISTWAIKSTIDIVANWFSAVVTGCFETFVYINARSTIENLTIATVNILQGSTDWGSRVRGTRTVNRRSTENPLGNGAPEFKRRFPELKSVLSGIVAVVRTALLWESRLFMT